MTNRNKLDSSKDDDDDLNLSAAHPRPLSGATIMMKLVALAALVATAASKSVSVFPATGAGGVAKQACVISSFGGHTCTASCSGMQDISSAAITTAQQCVAACCADPKVCTAALR